MTQSSQLPSQRTQPNAMDSRIKLCQLFAKHAKGMKHHWLHGFKDAGPSKIQSSLQVSETIQCSIELWVTSHWRTLEVPGSVWISKHCKRSVRQRANSLRVAYAMVHPEQVQPRQGSWCEPQPTPSLKLEAQWKRSEGTGRVQTKVVLQHGFFGTIRHASTVRSSVNAL